MLTTIFLILLRAIFIVFNIVYQSILFILSTLLFTVRYIADVFVILWGCCKMIYKNAVRPLGDRTTNIADLAEQIKDLEKLIAEEETKDKK